MTRVRPIALIYRGAAACAECPQAAAELLTSADVGFEVRFVGEREGFGRATLAGAALYVQPGGGRSLERAYRAVKGHGPLIREFVRSGGRYLGICMGGYLADSWRGFALLPPGAEADPYVGAPGADVTTRADTLVAITHRGSPTPSRIFFQDGPLFRLPAAVPPGTSVVARYAATGDIAALVCPFGRGWVGVCGPHPEAPHDWYSAHGLPDEGRTGTALGHDLLDALLSAGAPGATSATGQRS
ncbi:glutamine amidotransferase-like uncharacterized protein [Kineosphaera limosa]|uniref:Biotin-protein ligase N-terminal domain-containing protein n=1 Tax=Kineosphaera limosa NBRC 100340 TaxID=1184609 RepID=K6VGQ5_9MICO|nr:BPL-N domain-containing protein [Kineosphaera limosa]NYE00974.1 glutamine amidotransferase-like uncharacterized protein [Kineosphaera limosa]GAB95358.1 hypothetical protein KILIM_019_00100 [Kineosphaera limosa NBRC 100340]